MEAFLSQLERGRLARLRLPGGAGEVAVRSGELRREAPESRPSPFTYSFLIPGEIELPELGLRLRIGRAPVEPWMFRGDPNRAALAGNAAYATVRTRRPGDRLRPLGAAGARKLKELLIDRRVPVGERDRLPLLELDGRLAWVPGVAIDDAFRLTDESECWVAEMIPASQPLAESEARGERMSKT
jgi:tRNA(Ile)-lysidine synthase